MSRYCWEQLVLTCCQGHACIHAAQPRSRHFSRKGPCSRHLIFFFEQAVSGKTCYLNKVDAESANCTGSCTCWCFCSDDHLKSSVLERPFPTWVGKTKVSDLGKRFFGARAQKSLLEGELHKQNACLRLQGRWTRCRRQAPYWGLSRPQFLIMACGGSTSFWIESKAAQDALKFFDSPLYEPCLWETSFQNLWVFLIWKSILQQNYISWLHSFDLGGILQIQWKSQEFLQHMFLGSLVRFLSSIHGIKRFAYAVPTTSRWVLPFLLILLVMYTALLARSQFVSEQWMRMSQWVNIYQYMAALNPQKSAQVERFWLHIPISCPVLTFKGLMMNWFGHTVHSAQYCVHMYATAGFVESTCMSWNQSECKAGWLRQNCSISCQPSWRRHLGCWLHVLSCLQHIQ